MLMNAFPNILLTGDTGDGKSALVGELLEWVRKTKKQMTRLYNSDPGWETLRVYIDLGLVEPVFIEGNPFIWAHHASLGEVKRNGKWVRDTKAANGMEIGLYVFEGMSSLGQAILENLQEEAKAGKNIGGGGAHNFAVVEGGESLKFGSNNMTHFGVAQERVNSFIKKSQDLPGIVVWTALTRRGTDQTNNPTIAPNIVGKSGGDMLPARFKYTFRINAEPQAAGPPRRVLYLEDHKDSTAAGAKGFGNARVPLAGADVKVPDRIEPASLVQVMELLDKRYQAAKGDLKKRLGLS